ncbi:MAG: hypothetical protein HY716_15145 [Planctomycetes bacterium]|nr:hypothetical protein [Planctomycetota bacterium]
MQKWSYFTMGLLAGLVLVLGAALLAQGKSGEALASPPLFQGVDNQGEFVLAVGGAEQQVNDLLWVLHKHKKLPALEPREMDVRDKAINKDMISLCLYKADENGRKIKLVAVRNIAYEVEMDELKGSTVPPVSDIRDLLKKNVRKD